jgi:Zn-dependent protease
VPAAEAPGPSLPLTTPARLVATRRVVRRVLVAIGYSSRAGHERRCGATAAREPGSTLPSLEVSINVLGIPVRIGPSIVIGLLLIGVLSGLSDAFLVEWIVLGLIALLLHELGHAVTFRRYGVTSHVTFWALGGFTVPDDTPATELLSDRQMVVVALAGPGVSLVVGLASLAVLLVAGQFGDLGPSEIRVPISIWLFVNLGWAVFNLLPIGSLDGGQALSHLIGALVPGRLGAALGVLASLGASAIVAVLAIMVGLPYVAFIAVIFGLASPNLYEGLREAISPARAGGQGGPPNPPPTGFDDATDMDELRARASLPYGDRYGTSPRGDPPDHP